MVEGDTWKDALAELEHDLLVAVDSLESIERDRAKVQGVLRAALEIARCQLDQLD